MDFVELEKLCDFIRNGISVKQSKDKKGIPITRIETIWNGTIDKSKFGYADVFQENISKYQKYLLQNKDILMTHINSPKHLGKCAHYENEPKELIHGMNLLCIRVNNSIVDSKYLKHFFDSKNFRNKIKLISNQSVNQASFSAGKLKTVKIPLPSLSEQKRIAGILDEADKLRQLNQQLISKYNQLTQSLFLDMFGDPVTNPKGWKKVKFNQICSFDKKSFKPSEIKSGTFYVGLESIEKESGEILNKVSVEENQLKSNKFYFNENYILYGKLRPYLNKVGNPKFEGICSTDIIPIQPIAGKSKKGFITLVMRNPGFVAWANERCSGANLPRISPKEVEKYSIINPPIKLQNEFERRIQIIEQQKAQAQEALQKSEDLFNSLLQKAFKGEV